MLAQSPRLRESDLVELAKTKGQAHLLAIAGRADIGEAVTDVLVRRGNPEVVRTVADNQSAKLSEGGFSALVKRAEGDEDLAEKVGSRADIPPHLFRELLVRATAVVQQRLLASAKPETRAEIQRVLDKISREVRQVGAGARLHGGDAHRGARCIRPASSARPELVEFAKDEEVRGDGRRARGALRRADRDRRPPDGRRPARPDPHSLQGRRLRLGRPRARSSWRGRAPRARRRQSLDDAFANFERLSPSTAQRVVRFWQVAPATTGERTDLRGTHRLGWKIR